MFCRQIEGVGLVGWYQTNSVCGIQNDQVLTQLRVTKCPGGCQYTTHQPPITTHLPASQPQLALMSYFWIVFTCHRSKTNWFSVCFDKKEYSIETFCNFRNSCWQLNQKMNLAQKKNCGGLSGCMIQILQVSRHTVSHLLLDIHNKTLQKMRKMLKFKLSIFS